MKSERIKVIADMFRDSGLGVVRWTPNGSYFVVEYNGVALARVVEHYQMPSLSIAILPPFRQHPRIVVDVSFDTIDHDFEGTDKAMSYVIHLIRMMVREAAE